jgi:hypothetical protein
MDARGQSYRGSRPVWRESERCLRDVVRCQIVALDTPIAQLVVTADVTWLQRSGVGVDYRSLV